LEEAVLSFIHFMPSMKARSVPCALVIVLLIVGSLAPGRARAATQRPTPTPAATPVPSHGGTLVEGIQEDPDQLLPNFSGRYYTLLIQQALFAPLFYSDDKGVIQPGLASEVPTRANGGISADGRTYTLHLRRGLRWSDGVALTARDVDFSWRLWTNSTVKPQPYSTLGLDRIGGSAVSADGLSITFLLVQPYAPFVSDWTDTLQPLPAHVYSKIKPAAQATSIAAMLPTISSGPFTLQQYQRGDRLIVTRNPRYYQAADGMPYLSSIIFRVIVQPSAVVQALRAHTIDAAWLLPITYLSTLQHMSGVSALPLPAANWEAAVINLRRPLFKDVRVRQALEYGLNRAAETRTSWHGLATLIGSDQPPVSSVYAPDIAPYPYDPGKAGKLLDAAGWRTGSDGLRHKGSQVLTFVYSTTLNNPWRQQDEAQALADYERLGIQLVIRNFPPAVFLSNLQHGQFDMAEFVFNNSLDPDDTSSFGTHFVDPFGTNYGAYSSTAFDQLAAQEVTAVDATRRAALFHQMQQVLHDDVPALWLYSPDNLAAVSSHVHNYMPAPYSLDTWNCWQWWIDAGAGAKT
jgi:peptide/nickel transport system substrate-binding protein